MRGLRKVWLGLRRERTRPTSSSNAEQPTHIIWRQNKVSLRYEKYHSNI